MRRTPKRVTHLGNPAGGVVLGRRVGLIGALEHSRICGHDRLVLGRSQPRVGFGCIAVPHHPRPCTATYIQGLTSDSDPAKGFEECYHASTGEGQPVGLDMHSHLQRPFLVGQDDVPRDLALRRSHTRFLAGPPHSVTMARPLWHNHPACLPPTSTRPSQIHPSPMARFMETY